MMEDDEDNFDSVLNSLLMTKKRDPRAIRLAAVASAMKDVVGYDIDQSPAKFYASTVTTLSGESLDLATQLALLELLSLVIPHVPSSTLNATLPITSRTLRGVVSSCRQASKKEDGETKDELGGLNATLRACCRTTSQFLQHTLANNAGDAMEVRKVMQGTFLALWDDRRPKVRKAAQQGASELVMILKKNKAVQIVMADFVLFQLSAKNNTSAGVLHTLQWLQHTIHHFHKHVDKLTTNIMELLMSIVQNPSAKAPAADDTFVAKFAASQGGGTQQHQQRILLANAVMSLLVAMLEEQPDDEAQEKWLNAFAPRVLASLLQGKPTLVFAPTAGNDSSNLEDSAKSLYGQTLMVATQRILQTDGASEVANKLLPLSVQMLVQLAKPNPMEDATSAVVVAEGVFPQLTKLIRTELLVPDSLVTCYAELLSSLEVVVLQPIYRPTWSVSLMPLALMIQAQQQHEGADVENEEVANLVAVLIQRHTEEEAAVHHQQAIEEAVGALIQGVGLERFWKWISWQDEVVKKANKKKQQVPDVISPNKAWLLPLLKTSGTAASTTPPHLEFFQTTILGLARDCDAQVSSPHKTARVMDLWSLLSCFCAQPPPDFADVFPGLAQTLVRAMGDARYPQIVTIICNSLKTLAETMRESNDEEVLSKVSTKLLPALFKLVETLQGTTMGDVKKKPKKDDEVEDDNEMDVEEENKSTSDNSKNPEDQRVQSVTAAIAELARLAPQPYVQSLLKKVIQRLLTATQSDENESEKICTLLGLSQALVSSEALDEDAVTLLYRAVKPFIRSDEHLPRVQKRAYKALLEICKHHPKFATETDRLAELTDLLVGSLMTCQVSARHLRLKCMTVVVKGFDSSNKEQMEIIPKVIGEVLLCLKDSNGKTRESGYQLLLAMANVMDDMPNYFKTIAAALGAQTTHMRSAAVMAMSRLVFEFSRTDATVHAMLPMMLETVIVLFDENSREVIKSVVGFVRVCVAAMSEDQLEPILPEVVGGLFKYHKGKERFRAKIKIILKKLVRVYGYDKIIPYVPESDTRLLTHMRKLEERAARRRAAQRAEGAPETEDFDDMMESDEEDSDDGKTLMTGLTKFTAMTGRTGKSVRTAALEKKSMRSRAESTVATSRTKSEGPRLQNDRDGKVLDMLDPSMAKSVRFAADDDDDGDSDGGMMEFDELGRLVVPDDMLEESISQAPPARDEDGDDEILEIRGIKKRKLSKFESAKNSREATQKKKGANNKQVRSLGAAYKSKKAGGDVMKKGQKFEPYAFVPLDGKSYTKKNRRQAVESMSTVVRGGGGKRKRK
jgi:ribosomal RNA-processing protein 12